MITPDEVHQLVSNPHLCLLIWWLRTSFGNSAVFAIDDNLCDYFQWPKVLFENAIRDAVDGQWLLPVPTGGAVRCFTWGDRDDSATRTVGDPLKRNWGVPL